MPITAHPAFNKVCLIVMNEICFQYEQLFQASSYFKMKLKRIPVDPKTLEVDLKKMRRAITKNTCMVRNSKRINN